MISLPAPSDLERFRTLLGCRIGLRFDDAKLSFLGDVLRRRLKVCGWDSAAYLWELDTQPADEELRALARELTVGETYFFRNNDQFRALAELALPERLQRQQAPRVLRLLSAGCSSGEEAYSMAIVARETVADPSCKISIRAVDLNPAALERAARARYSDWALRETPTDTRGKWFREDGRELVLDESIRAMVTFEQANLASDSSTVWQPSAYDVIFCRNLLMYFEPEQMRATIARIARSLAPGGYLFLGHADTLRGVSDQFQIRNTHQTFYYQLKDGAENHPGHVVRFVPRQPRPQTPHFGQDVAWFDEICRASERIAALLPLSSAGEKKIPETSSPFDPAPAFELLRQERFSEALDHVRAATRTTDKTPEVLLLEAVLLVQSGQLDAAEEAAARLLRVDQHNAGAHYVLALCGGHAGRRKQAIEHHAAAIGIDPLFAMARLQLGLLLRRKGDGEAARREFALARGLFERESPSRILLFGGGFSREALMTLCDGALKECGGGGA